MPAPCCSTDLIIFSCAILVILISPMYRASCDIFTLRLITLFLARVLVRELLLFLVSTV